MNRVWFRLVVAILVAPASVIGVFLGLDGLVAAHAGNTGHSSPPARAIESAPTQLPTDIAFSEAPGFVRDIVPPTADELQFDAVNGVHQLLIDTQHDAAGRESAIYQRMVTQPVSITAVQAVSQYEIVYHPDHAKIALNHVRVERDGVVEDRSGSIHVDFLRREPYLEVGIITGMVSAIIRIDDVRTNDQVDIAWTTTGSHSAFGGRDARLFPLAYSTSIERMHFRSQWPADRSSWRLLGVASDISHTRSGRLEVFERAASAYEAVPQELAIPITTHQAPILTASNFRDWAEVGRWAQPLFQPEPSSDVTELAAQIVAAHENPADQIMAALRFVQDEVRYFLITLGDGGYVPTPVHETLRSRQGDCKAKALLFIALAQELGFEAHAALASLSLNNALPQFAPSPTAFDHVIVRLTVDDEHYWFDPTQPYQGGDLARATQTDYGFALLLDGQSSELSALPEQDQSVISQDLLEEFDISDGPYRPAHLRLEASYRGRVADFVRATIAMHGVTAMEAYFLDLYTRRYGELDAGEGFDVNDDREANIVVLSAEVRLADPFNDDEENDRRKMRVNAHILPYVIAGISTEDRVNPVALPYPLNVRQTIRTQLTDNPDPDNYALTNTEISNSAFEYSLNRDLIANELSSTYRLHVRDSELPAEKLAAVLEDQESYRRSMRYSLHFPLDPARQRPQLDLNIPEISIHESSDE